MDKTSTDQKHSLLFPIDSLKNENKKLIIWELFAFETCNSRLHFTHICVTLDVKQTNYSKSCESVIRNTHSCKAKIKGISPRRRFARKMGRQMVPSLGSFDSSFVLQQVDKSPEKIRHGAPNSFILNTIHSKSSKFLIEGFQYSTLS